MTACGDDIEQADSGCVAAASPARVTPARGRAQDKQANRKFVAAEGIADRSVEQDIVPVQKAVYKMAKAGEELQKEDAKSAADTLRDGWVNDFANAGQVIAVTPESKSRLEGIISSIKGLADAAGAGNVAEAKLGFVSAVESLESWVEAVGVAGQLKGL